MKHPDEIYYIVIYHMKYKYHVKTLSCHYFLIFWNTFLFNLNRIHQILKSCGEEPKSNLHWILPIKESQMCCLTKRFFQWVSTNIELRILCFTIHPTSSGHSTASLQLVHNLTHWTTSQWDVHNWKTSCISSKRSSRRNFIKLKW